MDIKFKENENVCFFINPHEFIQNWFANLGYISNTRCNYDYSVGTIKGIHIKDNKISYDIESYCVYGNETRNYEHIPEEFIFHDKAVLEKEFKNILIDYLDKVINKSKNLIKEIEKYKESIKND